ncbi:MAG: hypothetical protein IKN49_05400 [Elusimicrobiaceae bacterium]|nr:hypothetical protein [Elusimicrobiaceae bacterium]
MHYDKIDLENLIFLVAGLQQKEVLSKQGYLLVRSDCLLLNRLVEIYNHFFAEENMNFMERELEEDTWNNLLFASAYFAEQLYDPLQPSFHLDTH